MKENKNEEIEQGVEEYENALVQTGFGRYNLQLLMVGGSSIITVLIETLGLAYVIPAAQCDLNLTISDKSIISSVSFLGIVISCLLWGYLADSYGRRKMLLVSISASCFFGILSSIAPYVWLFIVCRFLNGFFIGCPASVSIAFVGEFQSNNYRSKIISWTGSFVAAASLYLPGICWLILPMDWRYPIPGLGIDMCPWRLVVILMSLPSFFVALTYWRIPESPKYLWSIGKSEECLDILRDIFATNTGKDRSLFPVTKFELNTKPEVLKKSTESSPKSFKYLVSNILQNLKNQTVPLFTMPLLLNVLLTSFLQFGIQMGAQGVFMWIPNMFNNVAMFQEQKFNESVTICNAMNYSSSITRTNVTYLEVTNDCSDVVNEEVFIITAIYGAVYMCVFTLIGFIVDIFGKKLLLVFILCITSMAGSLINVIEGFDAIKICIGLFQMMGPCMNLVISIQVDLFPTQHRAKAVAFSQMMGRIGAVAGSSFVGFLLEYHCLLVFYIFPAIYGILIISSCLLPIPFFVRRNKVESNCT